eukprot:TRINITY_DN5803_c0_g4_i1.p1 TRINITY_DN5803_c0_g4~~TRINITY_DN5803_c0_g4_i1.p1  ORF type:complete len:123 (-),score=48.25 TRINITY_DN5803_c0_g4_i1:37-405(-)
MEQPQSSNEPRPLDRTSTSWQPTPSEPAVADEVSDQFNNYTLTSGSVEDTNIEYYVEGLNWNTVAHEGESEEDGDYEDNEDDDEESEDEEDEEDDIEDNEADEDDDEEEEEGEEEELSLIHI